MVEKSTEDPWDEAFARYQKTPAYEKALSERARELSLGCTFGIRPDVPAARRWAESHVRFRFERDYGRFVGKPPPEFFG